ncbi:MAG: hypothetical protein JJT81_16795, partial [Rubellimicrobium sp.]|nr:hypothetical protein [Rubellimicrobium sp.]
IYTIGGGSNQITVDAIREGRFDATLSGFPRSEGYLALQALVNHARGQDVPNWIDPADGAAQPMIVTQDWLEANPDFVAEWEG